MSSGKKVIASLLISIIIFTIFLILSFTRLFSVIETKFYQPSVISGMEKRLKEISVCLDEYTVKQAQQFSKFIEKPFIKNISSYSENDEDETIRNEFVRNFILENPGVLGIRIIDSDGKKIYYSTFEFDEGEYNKNSELPYESIKSNSNPINKNKSKIIFDNSKERIIYSLPFYDKYELYKGSVIFYVAGVDFNRYLISKNILSVSEQTKLVATVLSNSAKQSKGFVIGLPSVSSDSIVKEIVDLWNNNLFDTQKVLHSQDYNWFVISDNSGKTGIISLVFKDDILFLNNTVKILLLLSVFITLFLITLVFFNIKQDEELVIREKIKKFRFSLINEYLLGTEDEDWNEVTKFLAVRKHNINHDIKKFLGKKGEKHKVLVENLLEKTWREVEQVIVYHEYKEEDDEIEELNQVMDFENIESLNKTNLNDDFSIYENTEEIEDAENQQDIYEFDESEEVEQISDEDIIGFFEDSESIEELECVKNITNDDSLVNFDKKEETEDIKELEETDSVVENTIDINQKLVLDEKDSILPHHFDRNNTSTVSDLDFEIKNPDFRILDEDESLFEKNDTLNEDFLSDEALLEDGIKTENKSVISEILPEAELEELNTIQVFSLLKNSNSFFYSLEDIEDLESIEETCANSNMNAIIESSAGLYMIHPNVSVDKVEINDDFRILVDSVLQNSI